MKNYILNAIFVVAIAIMLKNARKLIVILIKIKLYQNIYIVKIRKEMILFLLILNKI